MYIIGPKVNFCQRLIKHFVIALQKSYKNFKKLFRKTAILYIDILILCKVKNGGFIMAKIIKRVGIVFFVLVISFLLILGCVFAVNSATKDKNAEIQNNDGNVQTTAAKTYTLSGTCAQMAAKWNEAISYSKAQRALVQVDLHSDWTAVTDSTYGTSFGTGVGFDSGRIYVPDGANIKLTLSYYYMGSTFCNINRNLSTSHSNGEVFYVCGKLEIVDENFDTTDFTEALKNGNLPKNGRGGIITGGNSTSYCSAILVSGINAEFILDGGCVGKNKASVVSDINGGVKHGAIVVYNRATVTLKSGVIGGNIVDSERNYNYPVGAVLLDYGTLNLGANDYYGINICYNQCGGVAALNNQKPNLYGGINIYGNTFAYGSYNLSASCQVAANFTTRNNINCSVSSGLEIYDFNKFMQGKNPAQYFLDDSDSQIAMLNPSTYNVVFTVPLYVDKPPTADTAYKEYTGYAQTYTPTGFDSSKMNLICEAKTYVYNHVEPFYAYVEPKSGYFWSDSRKYERITYGWRITPKALTKPTVKTGSFEYNGQVKTLQLNNYSSTTMTISGNTATNAGSYSTVVSLKDKNNYKWSDNTTATFSLTWTITPKPISKPTAADSNEYIFNNAEQTYMPKGYNSSTMVITDNKNTNVGEYTAKVTPNSNHKWSDNTTTAVEFKYRIFPPGVVVNDGVKYDYLYIDSNNIKKSYGNSYIHRVDDQNLNLVNGISRHILGNIPINTSIETFLQNLYSDRNLIKIYAKESDITPIYDGLLGTRSDLSQTIATGYKVELYSNSTDTTPFDTIYLSVLGDINGDGMINASDVSYLRQVANDSTLLESMSLERQLACMINNKGGITEVDSEILRNYIGKEIDLDKFMESEIINTSTGYTYLTLDRDNMLRKTSTSKTNVIGNISVNTSVEMLKTKLAEMGINISSLTIYNRKGDEVSDNTAIVGTGWRIEVGGEIIYLSVLGDLTGDGRITAADISYLRAIAASDTTNVQDCILLSAILLNKGGITTADSEVLKQAIKGSILLSEYNN